MRYQRLKNQPVLVIDTPTIHAAAKVIPSSKVVTIEGKEHLAVKHDLDTMQVLRNIGIMVPSPIKYDYKWSGSYIPFDHQYRTAEFLTQHRRCFVLNEIGTGKSLSALWAADYLMQSNRVNKILILSPLSTLERVWGDELFRHFPHFSFAVLHGTAAKRKELLAQDHDVYIVNHDGFAIIRDELNKRDDINLFIVDEGAVYRNGQTDRYKLFAKFVASKPDLRLWWMTGAPTPTAPTDAWAQCRIINPDAVPKYFSRFRDLVMDQATQYKWRAKKNSVEILKHLMQPAIRFTRDECLDLPPTTYQTHESVMTPEQTKLYKQMMHVQYTELEEGSITAANEAVKAMKLIQIACGVVYDDDGNVRFINSKPRTNLMLDLVAEAGGKVIIYVPLRNVLLLLERELVKKDYTVGVVHGGVSKTKRDDIFYQFQHSPSPQILLAHPRCMSHGLTLTAAATIIWYAPYPSNETYGQANGRITRPSQEACTTIINMAATRMELEIYRKLQAQERLQSYLLDEIKLMMS